MKLKIKPLSDVARELYINHGHFHVGDAGLDLYVLENQIFLKGETKLIKLGISCEPENGRAYFLLPRSSISKTPLRLANSIGLIDAGYRGNLKAAMDYHRGLNVDNVKLEKGKRSRAAGCNFHISISLLFPVYRIQQLAFGPQSRLFFLCNQTLICSKFSHLISAKYCV